MRIFAITLLLIGFSWGSPVVDFIRTAREKHGETGEKAARFLVESMSSKDKESLTADFLTSNIDLSFDAREEFPWAKNVPNEIFLNDVLPYAVFDETRDPWRADFLNRARPLVKDAKTASDAAQILKREFFKLVNVHYHTGRKAPNQSPKESMESGRATCTGLSIILTNACRAVGIPARAVGTPMWSNGRGNHTWVEIWDNGWQFLGADEYDVKGLNRGWFTGDASLAKADIPLNAIYATSWKKAGLAFPMVWAPESKDVAAVNVTGHYTKSAIQSTTSQFGVRLFDKKGGTRRVAKVLLECESECVPNTAFTKAGTTDLNDMPRFNLKPGVKGRVVFEIGEETRVLSFGPLEKGDSTLDAVWSDLLPESP
jgi:hypothetical protein